MSDRKTTRCGLLSSKYSSNIHISSTFFLRLFVLFFLFFFERTLLYDGKPRCTRDKDRIGERVIDLLLRGSFRLLHLGWMRVVLLLHRWLVFHLSMVVVCCRYLRLNDSLPNI
jgi:hypothetical protein